MSDNGNKLTLIPVNGGLLTESREDSISISGKDERTRKEVLKIRDLDVSIREMELELKMARAETLDLQSKNREELKTKLLLESPETGTIAKNTRRFVELFADQGVGSEKSENTMYVSREPEASISITDEEKRRLVFLTDEGNFDRDDSTANTQAAWNPYSIDETSRQFLNELDKKLEESCNEETRVV